MEVPKEKLYNFELCYRCGVTYSEICKCKLHCRKCVNNHQWVECPQHSTADEQMIITHPRFVGKVHENDFKCENYCVNVDKYLMTESETIHVVFESSEGNKKEFDTHKHSNLFDILEKSGVSNADILACTPFTTDISKIVKRGSKFNLPIGKIIVS